MLFKKTIFVYSLYIIDIRFEVLNNDHHHIMSQFFNQEDSSKLTTSDNDIIITSLKALLFVQVISYLLAYIKVSIQNYREHYSFRMGDIPQ